MANELWRNSASQLAGMIARRETTSRAVVEAHLARIAEEALCLDAAEAIKRRLGAITPLDPAA